ATVMTGGSGDASAVDVAELGSAIGEAQEISPDALARLEKRGAIQSDESTRAPATASVQAEASEEVEATAGRRSDERGRRRELNREGDDDGKLGGDINLPADQPATTQQPPVEKPPEKVETPKLDPDVAAGDHEKAKGKEEKKSATKDFDEYKQ